jgi:hypothetical protein
MNPNADDRRTVAQGGLPARFHIQGPQPHRPMDACGSPAATTFQALRSP